MMARDSEDQPVYLETRLHTGDVLGVIVDDGPAPFEHLRLPLESIVARDGDKD